MEPKGSLPCLQVPATCPYPELDESSTCSPSHFHLCLGLPSCLCQVSTRLLFLISTSCPAYLILLDLIIRIIFDDQHRSLSSSLCSFPHSPVTSSPLGSNIFLSTLFSNTPSLHFSLDVSDHVSHPYKIHTQSLLTTIKASVFSYIVRTLPPNILKSSA